MKNKYTRKSVRRYPSRIVADCCCQRHDRSCCGKSLWLRLSLFGELHPPPVALLYPPSKACRTSTCSNLFFCNLFLDVHVCELVGYIYFIKLLLFERKINFTSYKIINSIYKLLKNKKK